MKTKSTELNPFVLGYISCAFWSTLDSYEESGGEPLENKYSVKDIAPETLDQMVSDCNNFQKDNEKDLLNSNIDDSRAGFLFWLNRNGHGAGFWDEYSSGVPQYKPCERLSAASKVYGSVDLTVGDDGKIY